MVPFLSSVLSTLQQASHQLYLKFSLCHFTTKEFVYSQGVDHSHVQKTGKLIYTTSFLALLMYATALTDCQGQPFTWWLYSNTAFGFMHCCPCQLGERASISLVWTVESIVMGLLSIHCRASIPVFVLQKSTPPRSFACRSVGMHLQFVCTVPTALVFLACR